MTSDRSPKRIRLDVELPAVNPAMEEDNNTSRLRKIDLLKNLPACFLSQVRSVWLIVRKEESWELEKVEVVYLVTVNDEVYVMGNDSIGVTGLDQILTPDMGLKKSEKLSGNSIKGIHTGWLHSVAWTEDGRLLTWASNILGRVTDTVFPAVPAHVTAELSATYVVSAACGMKHNLCLTESGKVFAWGCNDRKQVGNTNEQIVTRPRRVIFPTSSAKPIAVACSAYASFALMEDGKVYSWGSWSRVGERGVREHVLTVPDPAEEAIPRGEKIKKIVCGRRHILALSNDGNVFAWGSNDFGEVGVGTTENVTHPTQIKVSNVVNIGARETISVCQTFSGIYVWGKGDGRRVIRTTRPVDPDIQFSSIDEALLEYGSVLMEIQFPVPTVTKEGDIKSYCDSTFLKDVTFEVEGKEIKACRIFLNRCERFRTMFSGNWLENTNGVIKIKDFGYEVFQAFIKFLHTDEIQIADEYLIGLLELSDYYLMGLLREQVIVRLKEIISYENAVVLYTAANRFEAPALGVAVLEFMKINFLNVMHNSNMDDIPMELAHPLLKELKAMGAFAPPAVPLPQPRENPHLQLNQRAGQPPLHPNDQLQPAMAQQLLHMRELLRRHAQRMQQHQERL